MPPAVSVNKGCCGHQAISHYSSPTKVSPEGTQDGNRMPAIKPSATAAPQVMVDTEGTQDEKAWGASPR